MKLTIHTNASFAMRSFQAIMLCQNTNKMYTKLTNLAEILPTVFSKLGATSAMFLSHWGNLDAFSVVKNFPQKIP